MAPGIDRGGLVALRFESPSTPAELESVTFYVVDLGVPAAEFAVRIFDSDGADGAPGDHLVNAALGLVAHPVVDGQARGFRV